MNPLILASIKVSFLALGVIFLVLGILIAVIKVMTHLIPYQAPPPPIAKPRAAVAPVAASSEGDEHIAAIQAVMSHHLGNTPNLSVTQIQSK